MASIKIILFKSKTYSDDTHPVMLRITKNRKTKYFSTDFKCLPKQWDAKKSEFKRSFPKYNYANHILTKTKNKTYEIINEFRIEEVDFTLEQFQKRFKESSQSSNVYDFYQEVIKDLNKAGKYGSAQYYHFTCNSIILFHGNKKLTFNEINYRFLKKYETFLLERDCNEGGIAARMRCIRAIYNLAIKQNLIPKENYPFTEYKISKLKGSKNKSALSREEVNLIINFPIDKYPHLINARHYFVFSYYTMGMNFVPIAIGMMKLTWRVNIVRDKIFYTRSKTNRNFIVKIFPPIQEILDYYKALPSQTNYVFPILLKTGLTKKQIDNRKRKVLKQYNKQLKEMAEIVGIGKSISSYTSRHSFATNLKYEGVPIAVISESLGHSTEKVTQTYLKAFENEVISDAVKKLL